MSCHFRTGKLFFRVKSLVLRSLEKWTQMREFDEMSDDQRFVFGVIGSVSSLSRSLLLVSAIVTVLALKTAEIYNLYAKFSKFLAVFVQCFTPFSWRNFVPEMFELRSSVTASQALRITSFLLPARHRVQFCWPQRTLRVRNVDSHQGLQGFHVDLSPHVSWNSCTFSYPVSNEEKHPEFKHKMQYEYGNTFQDNKYGTNVLRCCATFCWKLGGNS